MERNNTECPYELENTPCETCGQKESCRYADQKNYIVEDCLVWTPKSNYGGRT